MEKFVVVSHFLLQGIFPTQGLNLRLLFGRWILYHSDTREDPIEKYLCIIDLQSPNLCFSRVNCIFLKDFFFYVDHYF